MFLRFFISFILVFSFSHAFARDCKDKAEKLVNQLESVLVKLEGYAQGDYDEEPMSTKVLKTTDKFVIYRIEADHTNEDNDVWSNNYEIKLDKDGCYIQEYKFLGYSKK